MATTLMTNTPQTASTWQVDAWLNADSPITLASLRGRVVVMLAFQMLCPGCVAHALPLAARVHRVFPQSQVAMLGLHTVFEHHEAMSPVGLRAFMHEYRVTFPVGIDRPASRGPIPETMRAYAMRGTPTWLLYDTDGTLRQQYFGDIDALRLGAEIMHLVDERLVDNRLADDRLIVDRMPQHRIEAAGVKPSTDACGETGCALPDG
jgi:peroxiredoxin